MPWFFIAANESVCKNLSELDSQGKKDVIVVVVLYFYKKYIAKKASIKCTNRHKMKAKCHVISTRDDTKRKCKSFNLFPLRSHMH